MLNVPERPSPLKDRSSHPYARLGAWLRRALDLPGGSIQVRLRGNALYILCEESPCPNAQALVTRLVSAIAQTRFESLLPPTTPLLHRIVLYGRLTGAAKPAWAETLELSQIDELWAQQQSPAIASPPPAPTLRSISPRLSGAAALKTLAQDGQPEAIARYLSTHLSQYNVAVRAKLKPLQENSSTPIPNTSVAVRLWVVCECAYSIDANLVAEPIAQSLRELDLQGIRDALVIGQVQGEAEPEWCLRVDLTPAQLLLRHRAAWGNREAIARLLNQRITYAQIRVQGEGTTLHLYCTGQVSPPDQQLVVAAIAALLKELAPRGWHGATVYGLANGAPIDQPTWVHWLELPASQRLDLADSAETRARRGELAAIAYQLSQQLNPNLQQTLATGGTQIQVRQRDTILHIMADALLCPPQKAMVESIAAYFRSRSIPGITGLCIYGRRSGQSKPVWRQGVDLGAQTRLVPEAAPEFAASDAYVGDLLSPPGALVWIPRQPKQTWRDRWENWAIDLQDLLLQTPIFTPVVTTQRLVPASVFAQDDRSDSPVALVWGLLGICLMVSVDWGLGVLARSNPSPAQLSVASVAPRRESVEPVTLPKLSLSKSKDQPDPSIFNASGFIQGNQAVVTAPTASSQKDSGDEAGAPFLAAAALQPKATIDPKQSPYLTFNADQLNERLVLYRQYVQRSGVPDVLIVGSSRALRGIDPTALEAALTQQGYPSVKVFNFGINGATAKVVDLVVRRLIPPNQLPKLILWADGARAFNSGRPDVTFNAIAASPGFQQLPEVAQPVPIQPTATLTAPPLAPAPEKPPLVALKDAYQDLDQQLTGLVGHLSAVYADRANLLQTLRDRFLSQPPASPTAAKGDDASSSIPSSGRGLIDIKGFLPLSNRFNPTTYYQKYTRVPGAFDSDYESFKLPGKQEEALKTLMEYVKTQKASLVFINLPLTAEYLDSTRRDAETLFQQYMIQQATDLGFTYRNLVEQWPIQNDYFSDPSHLNRYGAYAVSQVLAKDALIPWPQKKSPIAHPTPLVSPSPAVSTPEQLPGHLSQTP